ncbi:hypothetical protein JXD20_01100 [Candidatus Peregrinibacteria bacterium]|nr:hypothetical protein [Candidatus Peregrinibacteria bacterium]
MSLSEFPHQRPLSSLASYGINTPETADTLKQNFPRLYARVLDYLREKFCLAEADLSGHDDLIRLLIDSAECFERYDHLIIENTQLFRASVKNALMNLGIDSEDEEELAENTDIVRRNIGTTFEGVETFLEGFYPLAVVNACDQEMKLALREGAVAEMDDRFGALTAHWSEQNCALSDTEMEARFIERAGIGNRFLTTYCDSAFVGLVDESLQKTVDARLAGINRKKGWSGFVKSMKRRITHSLENIQPGQERRFLPENCFFAENGAQAFSKFRKACIPAGSRVLVTTEEYSEIIEDMEKEGIEMVEFSGLEDLIQKLDRSDFDFILASEVSRLGTVHRLCDYHKVRAHLSPDTKLIVDSCQSAGRWQHDLGACMADVVFLSTQKGSDLGNSEGVLVFSDDFDYDGVTDPPGSLGHELIGRTAFALNPDGLATLTPAQRAEAISDRTKKFLELVQAVNVQVGHRIQVLSPLDPGTGIMGHAVQLKVDGVSREDICELAESYGVYIADKQVMKEDDQSLRIAFHPYMNNQALKIIAYVLLLACDAYPLK